MKHLTSRFALRLSLTLLLGLASLLALHATSLFKASGKASGAVSYEQKITVQAEGRGGSHLKLRDGRELQTQYRGDQSATDAMRSGTAQARSLASADFDRDGAQDVVAGYAVNGFGIVTVQRGNPDAFAPHDDSVFVRMQEGENPDALLPVASTYMTPEAADFLAVGDFNQDGKSDVLLAARGGGLYLMAGDGEGRLGLPERIDLPGHVTALAAGEFKAADGKTDVAVAVAGVAGPQLLIYDGAESGLHGAANTYRLPSEATALEFGRLDSDPFMDVAVAAGNEVEIIHGWGRMNQPPNQSNVEHLGVPFNAQSLALGNFVWDRQGRTEIAVEAQGGEVYLLEQGNVNKQRFNDAELEERAEARRNPFVIKKQTTSEIEAAPGWVASQAEGWSEPQDLGAAVATVQSATGQKALVGSQISWGDTEDLLVLDAGQHKLNIVGQGASAQQDTTSAASVTNVDGVSSLSLNVTSSPVAVLALPTKLNGERNMVLLSSGSAQPSIVPLAPTATVTVNSTTDVIHSPGCATTGTGTCSLRDAALFAHANAGTTISINAGTYQLTISGGTGCDNSNAGDLVISPSTTIMGAGQASTTIQQTLTNARILCVNLPFAANTYNISALTMTGGRDANGVGGGAIVGGALGEVMNVTNVTFNDNQTKGTAATSGGGGLNKFGGNLTVTNCTFTNNTSSTVNAPAGGPGGGLAYAPGSAGSGQSGATGNLVMTGTTFTNNTAGSTASGGGGADLFTFNLGTGSFHVTNSTFTGNTATNGSGGGIIVESLKLLLDSTAANTTSLSSNTAKVNGGGLYLSGGSATIDATAGGTITFSGNTATNDANGAGIGVNTNGSNTDCGAGALGLCAKGTLNLADNVEVQVNGAWTNNAGSNVTFANLSVVDGSFTANNSTITVNSNINVAKNTLSGGTFNGNTSTVGISGNLNVFNGTFNAGTTVNLTGNLNIAAGTFNGVSQTGGTFSGGSSTVNINGNFNFTAGTFTAGTSTFNFNGSSAQSIGTNTATFNNLTINNAAGVNMGGNVTVGGTLTLTNGVFGVSTNTLTLNNTVSFTSGSINSSATGTVNYNKSSNSQNVAPGNYGNLTFSNFTKTLPNGNTIKVAGTFTTGAAGGHTVTGSTVELNGTSAQTLPSGFTTYNNLTLNNSSVGGVSGFDGLVVQGLLRVQQGTFTALNTTANNIQIDSGTTLAGTSAKTISLSGNWTNNGTFTANSNTVNFNGGATQTLGGTNATTFNNLTINNANGVNLGNNETVGGTLTLTNGVLGVVTNTLTLNSTVTITSGSISSSTTGTVNYNQGSAGQAVAPGTYGNLTFSNFNKTLPNGSTVGIAGTFTPGTATGHTITGNTIDFNGAGAQTVPAFTYNNLTVSGSGRAITLDSSGIIKIAGTFTPNTNNYTITGSTIEYNGTSAQALPSGFTTYNNLTLNNTAGTTGFAGLTVNGLIEVKAGTFTSSSTYNNVQIDSGATLAATAASTINVSGNWTNNGTFTASTGTVNFNGSSTQTLGGANATTFNNLTINNANGVNLGNNETVGGTLTLTNGVLGVVTNTLTLNGAVSFTGGSISSSTTGTVNYNQGSAGQAVAPGTYGNLTFSNFNKTLPNGSTVGIAGTFTPGTATGHTITGNTIDFNGAGAQTVPAFNYNNLTSSNTGARTLASSGTIGIAGTFTPGTNTYTITGSTIDFNGAGGQTIPAFAYNNLTSSNTGARTLASSGIIKIAGTFTPGTNAYTITGSTVEYNGTSAQALPSGFTTYNNLTLNNAAGTTGFAGLTVQGLLEVKAGTFTSSSTYNNVQIDLGATLAGTNATTINVSGNWTNNGTFTANGNTVNFNGSSAQSIGGTNATTFNNLTISNASGVTLGVNANVNGVLDLTGGNLDTSTFTLTMPATASSTGGGDVVGNVKRTGFVSGGSALSFGNPNNQITINSGTAPTDITVNLVKAVPSGPISYPNAVQRTYTITPNGGSGISATLRLHYLDSELNGNTEGATLNLWRYNGTGWTPQPITAFDTTANWVEKSGVTQFSPWTMNSTNSPTNAPARISGRIVTGDGTPLGGVVVHLGGGTSLSTITDADGFYKFDSVAVNNLYTVVPERANYSFTPTNLSFSLVADKTDALFTATADSTPLSNPLETDMFFVRQHYLDFLGREPDGGGLLYWTSQIGACGGDANCLHERKIDVSAAFFVEQEYQQTGSFVYRLYKAGLGRRMTYAEYAADRQQVTGGDQLAQSQIALSEALVNRTEFAQKYSGAQTAEQFVDALLANVKQASGVDLIAGRGDYVNLYESGSSPGVSRANVLRAVIDSNEFKQTEYNNSFVLIEYFGYLRRDPDDGGYQFWLNVLNNRVPGNYRSMVCAFITSAEYQQRFASVVVHTNRECGP